MSDFNLTKEQEQVLIQAITEAEQQTSGELRIHIESNPDTDPMERAKKVFEMLEMHQTALRNGVLFYVATAQRSFVILGDKGIHELVAKDFWNEVKETVIGHFKEDNYVRGLKEGVLMAGQQLQAFFPYQDDDIDELSNEISKGE